MHQKIIYIEDMYTDSGILAFSNDKQRFLLLALSI